MPSTSDLVNQLRNVLGADLLAFTLNIDVADLEQLAPNSLQSQALEKLAPAIEVLSRQAEFERAANIVQMLCTYNEELDTSWATYLHYFCRATNMPDFSDVRDVTERNLMKIARDIFPVFLSPKDQFGTPNTTIASYMHPASNEFRLSLTKAGNPIRKLFSGIQPYSYYKYHTEELKSINANIMLSNGQSGTIPLYMILDGILSSSSYVPSPNNDEVVMYAQGTRSVYRDIKRLANGRVVDIRTLVGLGNVELSSDIESIRMKNILIKRPSPVDIYSVFGDETNGMTVAVEIYKKTKILDVYEFTQQDSPQTSARYERYSDVISKHFTQQQRDIDSVRLAMLLASNDEEFIAPSFVFTTQFNPLGPGRNSTLNPYKWPIAQFPVQTIHADQARLMQDWFVRLSDTPKTLDVSIKRLLSAVTERRDAADAFIDAVMVWENLFGAKQETTLRIKGAMSLLLEPKNSAKRKIIMKSISELYDKRSRLVHGSPYVDLANIQEDRTISIYYALESFKKVLTRKSLLMAQDSESRGQIIMFKIR